MTTTTKELSELSAEELVDLRVRTEVEAERRLAAARAELDRQPLIKLGKRRASRATRRESLYEAKSDAEAKLAKLLADERSDRPKILAELRRWEECGLPASAMATALLLRGSERRRIYDLLNAAHEKEVSP